MTIGVAMITSAGLFYYTATMGETHPKSDNLKRGLDRYLS